VRTLISAGLWWFGRGWFYPSLTNWRKYSGMIHRIQFRFSRWNFRPHRTFGLLFCRLSARRVYFSEHSNHIYGGPMSYAGCGRAWTGRFKVGNSSYCLNARTEELDWVCKIWWCVEVLFEMGQIVIVDNNEQQYVDSQRTEIMLPSFRRKLCHGPTFAVTKYHTNPFFRQFLEADHGLNNSGQVDYHSETAAPFSVQPGRWWPVLNTNKFGVGIESDGFWQGPGRATDKTPNPELFRFLYPNLDSFQRPLHRSSSAGPCSSIYSENKVFIWIYDYFTTSYA